MTFSSRRIEIEGHGPTKIRTLALADFDNIDTRQDAAELIARATLRPKLTADQVAALPDAEIARLVKALRSMTWFHERSGMPTAGRGGHCALDP